MNILLVLAAAGSTACSGAIDLPPPMTGEDLRTMAPPPVLKRKWTERHDVAWRRVKLGGKVLKLGLDVGVDVILICTRMAK